MTLAISSGLKLKKVAVTTVAGGAPSGADRPAKYTIRPGSNPTPTSSFSVSGTKYAKEWRSSRVRAVLPAVCASIPETVAVESTNAREATYLRPAASIPRSSFFKSEISSRNRPANSN